MNVVNKIFYHQVIAFPWCFCGCIRTQIIGFKFNACHWLESRGSLFVYAQPNSAHFTNQLAYEVLWNPWIESKWRVWLLSNTKRNQWLLLKYGTINESSWPSLLQRFPMPHPTTFLPKFLSSNFSWSKILIIQIWTWKYHF